MIKFDISAVLDALGLEYDVRGAEASALCPGHIKLTGRPDHSPSWWINMETGVHICFSCGYKGNLLQLVCDIKDFRKVAMGVDIGPDYDAAKAWVDSISEFDADQMFDYLKQLPGYLYSAKKVLEMSEARLVVFDPPPADALASRNITAESAEKYGVLWDSVKKNWILPIREPHFGKLMGWQEKGTVDRTFMNRPAGLQRSKSLFGVENQQEDQVIVLESPLDCLRLESAGIHGAVAVCGSSVSEDQMKLLRYSHTVIAAFDNPNLDESGKKASKEMLKLARKYGINLFFFNYGTSGKKDPGDMTDDEIRWGVANAKSALYGELAYVQGNAEAIPG